MRSNFGFLTNHSMISCQRCKFFAFIVVNMKHNLLGDVVAVFIFFNNSVRITFIGFLFVRHLLNWGKLLDKKNRPYQFTHKGWRFQFLTINFDAQIPLIFCLSQSIQSYIWNVTKISLSNIKQIEKKIQRNSGSMFVDLSLVFAKKINQNKLNFLTRGFY